MRNLRKIVFLTFTCVFLMTGVMTATAAEEYVQIEKSQTSGRQTRVNWSGSAYISDQAYTNVTSSNNLFNDKPKVTNHAGNGGTLSFRIVNERGEYVGSVKTCAVGSSVTMDEIPHDSGDYTLQAKASAGKTGSYVISID